MAIYSEEKKRKQYQQPAEQQAATTQAAQSPIGGGITAQQRYDQVLGQQPQQQVNPFDQQIQDIYGKITGRGPFQYDVNGDALFHQYKDQAVGLGKTAMMDTMGQAAGLTGGYGSTYGQQVGQQAYNAYLQGLNEMVPELQQQAYGRYQDEGDALERQYAMLKDQQAGFTADQERLYNQWLNSLQIAEGDRNFAYQQEQDRLDREWNQQQFEYQKQQDAIDQQNWLAQFNLAQQQGSDKGKVIAVASDSNKSFIRQVNDTYDRDVKAGNKAQIDKGIFAYVMSALGAGRWSGGEAKYAYEAFGLSDIDAIQYINQAVNTGELSEKDAASIISSLELWDLVPNN